MKWLGCTEVSTRHESTLFMFQTYNIIFSIPMSSSTQPTRETLKTSVQDPKSFTATWLFFLEVVVSLEF